MDLLLYLKPIYYHRQCNHSHHWTANPPPPLSSNCSLRTPGSPQYSTLWVNLTKTSQLRRSCMRWSGIWFRSRRRIIRSWGSRRSNACSGRTPNSLNRGRNSRRRREKANSSSRWSCCRCHLAHPIINLPHLSSYNNLTNKNPFKRSL